MKLCTTCNASPVNATGEVCDVCMIKSGGIFNAPIQEQPQAIKQIQQPTMTDVENDNYDTYTKSFENGLDIKVLINYTKNFSEIAIYKDGTLADTKTYDDKEVFEKTLKNAIQNIKAQEEERKRQEEERKKYFEDIKSVVGDLGFDEVEKEEPQEESSTDITL